MAHETENQSGDSENDFSLEQLVDKLGSSDWRVRDEAADVLVSKGEESVDALISKLWDGAPEVRCTAADALGRIGDIRALDPLIDHIDDGDIKVRETVALAVEKIAETGIAGNLTPLQEAVCRASLDDFSKAADGGNAAISLLIMKIWEPDEDVRFSASEALVKIGTAAVPQLIKALETAEPEVTELGIFDPDYVLRATAARILGKIGDRRAVRPLVSRLVEPKVGVRVAAINALAKIGDPEAVEPLASVMFCGDGNVRIAAAKALGEIGDPRGIEPLKRLLPTADEYCWKIVHDALAKIGGNSKRRGCCCKTRVIFFSLRLQVSTGP